MVGTTIYFFDHNDEPIGTDAIDDPSDVSIGVVYGFNRCEVDIADDSSTYCLYCEAEECEHTETIDNVISEF